MEKPFHIVTLGESGVGKTTLSKNSGRAPAEMTIGVDYVMRHVEMPGETVPIKLQIFDCAGQRIYNAVCRNYYLRADAAILVFDISAIERTWSRVVEWLTELLDHDPDMGIVLVGNKSDLVPTLSVEQVVAWHTQWERAREIADKYDVPLLATSHYTGENAAACMQAVVRQARKKRAAAVAAASAAPPNTVVKLTHENAEPPRSLLFEPFLISSSPTRARGRSRWEEWRAWRQRSSNDSSCCYP